MKFWNTVQINRKGPLIMLAYQTGFFAFGVAMVLGINTFLNKDMDYACMGSLMAAIGIAAGIVARGGTSAVRFRLAVMMGQPRRSFLLWDTLNTAAVAAMGYLVSWIFYQTELALYRALYPGYACQISMDKFFAWPVPLAVIPTICVLDLAIGVLQVRFGAKETMGTGLGMPIVKNLVTRMGGQITVSSALGQGTTFTVTLPFDVGEVLPAPREEQLPVQDMQLEGLTILLAEDNFLNMEIATELLQMRGAKVTPAENGRKALEAFQDSQPYFFDAVLMDMQMPEMDGCQATEAIRALNRPDAQTVPIIALTANAFAEDISRTAQAGMNAHLAKPIHIEQLCAVLTKLMSEQDEARGKKPTEGK